MLGPWKLHHVIGRGGNGQVWLAKDSSGQEAAVKILLKDSEVALERFRNEITANYANQDLTGILPVLGSHIPISLSTENHEWAWFAMPVAERLTRRVHGQGCMVRTAKLIVEIATTLARLHARGVSHRDLKPANLLFRQGQPYVADFGLVDYPGKPDVTGFGQQVGSRLTAAPETLRYGNTVDPRASDVYSLAKSLWMILAENEKGFEGQYAASGSLDLRRFVADPRHNDQWCEDTFAYWHGLDSILTKATDHDSEFRPPMAAFASDLLAWTQISSNWGSSSAHNWQATQRALFPVAVPKRTVWTDPTEIAAVLARIGMDNQMNHMFYPDGGGMDLTGAAMSRESGCVELHCGDEVDVVKPLRLTFECVQPGSEWNYFRLETRRLRPIFGIHDARERDDNVGFEEVAEVPGRGYVAVDAWYTGSLDGEPLPLGARRVARYFGGPFVLFQKSAKYNHGIIINGRDAYQGIHSTMSASEFRRAMHRCLREFG